LEEPPLLPLQISILRDIPLIERALAVSGEKTKKAAVTRALEEFIARRQQARIRDLFGSLDWDPSFDYKRARSRR